MTKNMGSWSLALIETMKDPLYRVISSEIAVAIKDKFPKAKYHFLILPYEDIPTLFHVSKLKINLISYDSRTLPQLTSSERHLQLMDELELLAKNVIEVTGQDENAFKIGYHSDPSMQKFDRMAKFVNHLRIYRRNYWLPSYVVISVILVLRTCRI